MAGVFVEAASPKFNRRDPNSGHIQSMRCVVTPHSSSSGATLPAATDTARDGANMRKFEIETSFPCSPRASTFAQPSEPR